MNKPTQVEADRLLSKRLKQLKSYGYHFCCRDYFRKLIKEYIDDDLDSLKGFFYKWHRANYSWLFGDLDDSDGTWFTRIRNGSIGAEIHDSGVVDIGRFFPFIHKSFRYEHTVIDHGFRITEQYIYAGFFLDGELWKGYLYIPESGLELRGSFEVAFWDGRLKCKGIYEQPGIGSFWYAQHLSFRYEKDGIGLYWLNDATRDYIEAVLNGDDL